MTFWLSALFTAELLCVFCALYALLRRPSSSRGSRSTRPALAIAISYVLLLAGYSMLAHLLFYAGLQLHSWPVDLALLAGSGLAIYQRRGVLQDDWQQLREALRGWPRLWLIGTVLVSGYLLAQAWLLPPASQDGNAYHLPRILLFLNTGSLHPEQYNYVHQVMHSIGYDLLSFWFLRFHSDFGLGLFSWLAYGMILIGTASLILRMYRRPGLAGMVVLCTAGFTGLLVQASSVKNDLTVAALSVCLVLFARELLRGRLRYLPPALLAAAFAFTCKYYSAGFAAPLLALIGATLLWRRRSSPVRFCQQLMRATLRGWSNRLALALSALVAITLLVHWGHNLSEFGQAFGDAAAVAAHRNGDGLPGAVANLIRYVFQLSAPPALAGGAALEALLYSTGLLDRTAGVPAIYHGQALAGGVLSLLPIEESSWYGLAGALLWLPALLAGIFVGSGVRGRDALLTRYAMFALIVWLLLLAWSLAWTPFINRYFALFFSVLPPGLAALFARIQSPDPERAWLDAGFRWPTNADQAQSKSRLAPGRLLAMAGWLWLIFILTTQLARPAINIYELAHAGLARVGRSGLANFKIKQAGLRYPGPLIGTWPYFAVDRNAYYRVHFFGDPITPFVEKLPPNARLLILAAEDSQVFPFLLKRPDAQITLGGREQLSSLRADNNAYDFVLLVGLPVPAAIAERRNAAQTVFHIPENLSGRTPVTLLRLE